MKGVLRKKAEARVCLRTQSLFWKDVYDSLMLGEGERVPSIRHHFQRKEWEAIPQIRKDFRNINIFHCLSKTFLASWLFGESAASEQMLMESFMQYVSEDECKIHPKMFKWQVGG